MSSRRNFIKVLGAFGVALLTPLHRSIFVGACLLLGSLLAACTPVDPAVEPSPVPPTAAHTPIILPTITPSLSPTLQPTTTPTRTPPPPSSTPVPRVALTPLLTPADAQFKLRFDSWSPDERWIAYWLGEGFDQEDMPLPASLAFVEVASGKTCPLEAVTAVNLWDGRVDWQGDGMVIVIPNPGGEPLSGAPCEPFIPSAPLPTPEGEISPDGSYRIDHQPQPGEEGTIHFVTILTEVATGRILETIPWDLAPGAARREGPGWLTNEIYVIGPSPGRGVLYIDVSGGEMGDILHAQLNWDVDLQENAWSVFTNTGPQAGSYHLLFQWEEGPERMQLLLYHSEFAFADVHDQVEELPFYQALPFDPLGGEWFAFSPSGEWLLIGEPVPQGGAGYWLRRLHPMGSPAIPFGRGLGVFQGLSPKERQAAFYNQRAVQIVSFPEGELLSQWETPGYQLSGLWWSPGGASLAAVGLPQESGPDALFVIVIQP